MSFVMLGVDMHRDPKAPTDELRLEQNVCRVALPSFFDQAEREVHTFIDHERTHGAAAARAPGTAPA